MAMGSFLFSGGTPASTPKIKRYRVHFILTAHGFPRPQSFRVDVYAYSFHQAQISAEDYLMRQPLSDVEVLSTWEDAGPLDPPSL